MSTLQTKAVLLACPGILARCGDNLIESMQGFCSWLAQEVITPVLDICFERPVQTSTFDIIRQVARADDAGAPARMCGCERGLRKANR